MAGFHLFFCQSDWKVKAGLLACPPPPIPWPIPRDARRCESFDRAEVLHSGEANGRVSRRGDALNKPCQHFILHSVSPYSGTGLLLSPAFRSRDVSVEHSSPPERPLPWHAALDGPR